jgi:hypothetical protein
VDELGPSLKTQLAPKIREKSAKQSTLQVFFNLKKIKINKNKPFSESHCLISIKQR